MGHVRKCGFFIHYFLKPFRFYVIVIKRVKTRNFPYLIIARDASIQNEVPEEYRRRGKERWCCRR
jgi:hypothetical protein